MFRLALLATFTVCLLSCSKSNDENQTAKLSVYLTDDPAQYQAVNVDIRSIEVKYSDDETDNGWTVLAPVKAGVYNLLDFTNGMDTLLTSAELPAGKLKQIRLILGNNNSIVLNNSSLNLETPSAQQSGLKLKFDADLTAGVEYKLWLDFDAGKSIVQTGNNKYILKPVIRAYTQAVSGAIKGMVNPALANAWIYAIQNTNDTVATAAANQTTGFFLLNGMPSGTYTIAVDAAAGYTDKTINNVTVTTGNVTDIGTIAVQ